MPQPNYGSEEDIGERLMGWADRLSCDKAIPWVGMGIIADLKTAGKLLGGTPTEDTLYERMSAIARGPAPAPKPEPEYDL